MSHNPHEKANFAEQFKDYSQTSSQLQMLDKLEDAKINGTTLSLGML